MKGTIALFDTLAGRPAAAFLKDGVLEDLLIDPPDDRIRPGTTQSEEAGGSGRIVAPMHGTLIELSVAEGDEISAGSRVAVVEAMKMQHSVRAGGFIWPEWPLLCPKVFTNCTVCPPSGPRNCAP